MTFNRDYTKVISTLQPFGIMVMQASDGTLLKSFFDQLNPLSTVKPDGIISDSRDKIYFSIQT